MVHYCKLFFETFPFPRKWAQEVADNVMQVTISGNSGTLLDYGIHTEPSPLEATLAAGTPPQSVIQIVVSNGSTSAVWCRQITFTLPVGTAAADLCDSTAAGQIKFLSAAPGWTLVSPSPGVFVATPTETSFQQIEPSIVNPQRNGMININTATATALACIPGIGTQVAPQVLTYRQSNPSMVPSITWLVNALQNNTANLEAAGPYITAYSFQFAADIVAVGHENRGYRRVLFIFDCSSGTPLIVYRQDLTYLGWPLGKKLHDQLIAQK